MPYNILEEDSNILHDNVATNFLFSYRNSILMFNIEITFDTQPISSHGHPYPSNTI